MESDTQEPIASTTGTQKPKKWAYTHKYQTAWESNAKFCKSISVSKKGDTHFHCRTCACDCKGGISAVQKHNSSKKHIELSSNAKVDSVFNMPSMIKQKAMLKNIKETEIRIVSFVVEHNIPINVSDHLVSLINSIQLQPKYLAKLTCDRTKCTAIINNVIATTGFEDLVNYLKTNKFSLLVDESTDISSVKILAMVVRTCQNFEVTDQFLTLLPVANATADSMHEAINHFFNSHEIPYQTNLIGFAADGANAMNHDG
ncbi:uncharacterized protein LOC103307857 [Acyrthosiphon pisum]|uniref:DUF4371 domain-containing protein n=1 Tax=Acyrthosiphon pisum TaxID=7029 RepID=A0A8R1X096_ACYPI|nr:uncharacterized protein LOC103307857 [Acyrthosiphon pisum]|eukprot:XP_008178451.1 PREDICTED: uncharacterized protein LOC103307857 [Acyrthosiphon pisum]